MPDAITTIDWSPFDPPDPSAPPAPVDRPTTTERHRPPAERTGLLLGDRRGSLDAGRPVGFGATLRGQEPLGECWSDRSEAHALVVAPTGAGKTTWLACQLAEHPGSAVVVDPKGELAAMTARRRLELGNDVVVLDPFGVTKGFDVRLFRGRFDPGRWLASTVGIEDEAMALAAEIHAAPLARDPFWAASATDLTAALILHVYLDLPPEERSWARVAELHFTGDFDLTIAQLLDAGAVSNPTARESLAAYLTHPERETRPSVLSTARAGLRAFHTPQVKQVLSGTSFDAAGMVSGERPVTLYLVLPPQNMVSHAPLVRLWLTALLRAFTSPERAHRRADARSEVLFLIDELPALGRMGMVPSLFAYLRSFGVRAVAVVQSLAQLEVAYEAEARVIRENAGLRLAFGVSDLDQAEAAGSLLGIDPDVLLGLARDEMVVRTGAGVSRCRRATHLDPTFVTAGCFDPNPFHATGGDRWQR
ncbi:MAG: type IV secretory system conjugative DNA transfer family protein [Acidimicrobiales bacterium]|nr:type IV secretory system conjugative DNA transfer family protein [Acidimicrobiales bacterium]